MPPRFLFCSPIVDFSADTAEIFDLFYYKNTAGQGIFSLKQLQSWYPLHFLAENIPIDSDVVEYPTWRHFEKYIQKQRYDLVGISFTVQSASSVLQMIDRIRKKQPRATIVLGGYGTALCTTDHPLGRRLRDATDLLCTGEGLSFLQNHIAKTYGQSPQSTPVQRFPPMRLSLPHLPFSLSSIPIAVRALGCPNQCGFCATSHQYNGKKRYLLTPETFAGHLSALLAANPGIREILVYDEDFLDNSEECRRMMSHFANDALFVNRHQELIVFSSVRSIQQYTLPELKTLHIGTVFIGVESTTGAPMDSCTRLKRGTIDLQNLFDSLHAAGIRTIASIIGGWDGQTAQSLEEESRRFASLNPTFYQVLPLGAPPGTPLWRQAGQNNRRNDDLFSSPRRNVITNLDFQHLDDYTFWEWQRTTCKALIANGGPWFFRAAKIHLCGLRQGEKHHRARLIALLPLVFAAGPLYFRRGKYPHRWIRFIGTALRYLPVESILLCIAGIPLVYLMILPIQGICRVWHLVTGTQEYPPMMLTHYQGRTESSRSASTIGRR